MKTLLINNNEIMKYWDFAKNEKDGINPSKLGRNSHTKAFWVCCNCGCSFERTISKVKETVLCKDCSIKKGVTKRIKTYTEKYGSLLEMYPEIIREWDYEKNSGLDPNEITSHSSQ